MKETILWGNITWSEMRKQNIQAKKIYSDLANYEDELVSE